MLDYFYLFSMALVSSLFLTAILVWNLSKLKVKQIEREEGPESHKVKSGTPTMGGLGFVIVIAVFAALMVDLKYLPAIFLLCVFSLIGFLDDSIKVIKSRNLGLTFWQKIILQTLFALSFTAYLVFFTNHWQNSGIFVSLGIPFYFLFSLFVIVGTANAANLTDGLDGLLSGCSIIAFSTFLVYCLKQGLFGGAGLCVIIISALFGFLFFNFPRSKIFMGDTGSLGLGALLAGFAFVLHQEFAIALIGGVFLVEALSVIMQVVSYKLWKKRVFKMAPIHHHFELLGLSELNVVLMFWAVQLVLGIIGVLIL